MAFNQLHHIQENTISVSNGVFGDHGQKFHNVSQQNSKTKIGNIRYISCGEYGTLAVFTVGKLLYCKFNGSDKNSQSVQTNVAQLPDEYILNDSIGVYRAALIGGTNTNIGNIQIKADGNIDMYCPYPYLYGIVIIPTKQ